MKRWVAGCVFFICLIFFWEGVVLFSALPPLLLPSPQSVGRYLIEGFWNGTLIEAALTTLYRLFTGYFFSILLGIPLGFLNARFQIFEYTFGSVALALQTLPSICWTPLAILWFGQSEQAIVYITVMGSLWSIVVGTDHAIRRIPPIYMKAAKTLGSKGIHLTLKVILPAAFPAIFHGLKLGWAFAWRSLMAAEIYISVVTGFGLGELLHYNRELLAMEGVIAVMFVIVLIGFAAHALVFCPIEKFLFRYWGVQEVD